MIRHRQKKGQETSDLFQDIMPEPLEAPEETDAQRRRRREIDFHTDVKFRDLDYPEVKEPAEMQTVLAIRKWASMNLPLFLHRVQSERFRGKTEIRWSITANDGLERVTLGLEERRGQTFPDNLRLLRVSASAEIKQNLSTLQGRALSLTTLKNKILKALTGPRGIGDDGEYDTTVVWRT